MTDDVTQRRPPRSRGRRRPERPERRPPAPRRGPGRGRRRQPRDGPVRAGGDPPAAPIRHARSRPRWPSTPSAAWSRASATRLGPEAPTLPLRWPTSAWRSCRSRLRRSPRARPSAERSRPPWLRFRPWPPDSGSRSPTPFCYVHDVDKMIDFYENTLGFEVMDRGPLGPRRDRVPLAERDRSSSSRVHHRTRRAGAFRTASTTSRSVSAGTLRRPDGRFKTTLDSPRRGHADRAAVPRQRLVGATSAIPSSTASRCSSTRRGTSPQPQGQPLRPRQVERRDHRGDAARTSRPEPEFGPIDDVLTGPPCRCYLNGFVRGAELKRP